MARPEPAGDFDYEAHGGGYAVARRTDPRIAALVLNALGDAQSVLNVGAGAGSYEPVDRDVTAVEPSAAMRAQRPAAGPAAIDATAERPVPIPIDCVDEFTEAYYARPEAFLDPAVRRAQSAWGFISADVAARGLARLQADLESGAWDRGYGQLRTQPEFIGALRLITVTAR